MCYLRALLKSNYMFDENYYCVVLAGGKGTRLWPLSRKVMPKQFIDFNNDGTTLLRKTVDRLLQFFHAENIIVSTNLDYYEVVCEQLPYLDRRQILREPVMKGTAPSLTMAAFHIRDLNPNAAVMVVPSDIVLDEADVLESVVSRGLRFVDRNDGLLMVGIRPTHPETRYGYIQADDKMLDGMYRVRTFTEKPEASFAKIFVESGEFYWNSGIMMWNVNAFIETVRHHQPDMEEQFAHIYANNHNRDARRSLLYSVFESFPHISIDRAVLEKADNVYMMLEDFVWSDIETWDLLYDYCNKDDEGNYIGARMSQIYNCRNNVIVETGEKKLVVIDNLSDYIVVDTDNVLLICRRGNEAEFKRYINDSIVKFGDEYV